MLTFIAVPCMDMVPATFCQSITTLQRVGNCRIAFQMGSLVYTSRNSLAAQALEQEADYILWLDSDMVFNPDLLERMIETAKNLDADFLTGVYYRRVEPYTPVLFEKLELREEGGSEWTHFNQFPEDAPFKVGGCGFGCVLMSTGVVMDVSNKFNGRLFHPLDGLGEDLSFCWRARQCGYEIYADPSIPLGHMGYSMIGKAHWKAYERQRMDNLLGRG